MGTNLLWLAQSLLAQGGESLQRQSSKAAIGMVLVVLGGLLLTVALLRYVAHKEKTDRTQVEQYGEEVFEGRK